MIAKALDAVSPTLKEIAAEAGITYSAIRLYRKGARTAPPNVVRRLGAVLVRRGGELRKLGEQLERAAGRSRQRGRQ